MVGISKKWVGQCVGQRSLGAVSSQPGPTNHVHPVSFLGALDFKVSEIKAVIK